MAPYKTKSSKTEATSLREVTKVVRATYKQITSKTKRQPYVRSAYFKGSSDNSMGKGIPFAIGTPEKNLCSWKLPEPALKSGRRR